MFNFLRKRTISDDAKDFEIQFKVAKVIIFWYLELRFKQLSKSPDYKILLNRDDLCTTTAAQIENYLLGKKIEDTIEKVSPKVKEEILQIKDYIPQWTDDAINQDENFCKFAIQTIRMNMIFNQYYSDSKWLFETQQGQRTQEILKLYGEKVPDSPNPKKYGKMLKEWMAWHDLLEKEMEQIKNVNKNAQNLQN